MNPREAVACDRQSSYEDIMLSSSSAPMALSLKLRPRVLRRDRCSDGAFLVVVVLVVVILKALMASSLPSSSWPAVWRVSVVFPALFNAQIAVEPSAHAKSVNDSGQESFRRTHNQCYLQ